MRNLLTVFAALVVILAVISGNLWRELRSERQLVADLRAHMIPDKAASSEPVLLPLQAVHVQVPVPVPVPVPTTASNAAKAAPTPAPAVQIPQPRPLPELVKPGPALSTSLPQLMIPSGASQEARHAAALSQSDETATARVLTWRERLTGAGQTLTSAQLQALIAATITEMKRETEESLAIDNTVGQLDADSVARMREETINRQNDTNLRVLDDVTDQLTADQIKTLRTQFEAGHAARLASARADRERAANGGN